MKTMKSILSFFLTSLQMIMETTVIMKGVIMKTKRTVTEEDPLRNSCILPCNRKMWFPSWFPLLS